MVSKEIITETLRDIPDTDMESLLNRLKDLTKQEFTRFSQLLNQFTDKSVAVNTLSLLIKKGLKSFLLDAASMPWFTSDNIDILEQFSLKIGVENEDKFLGRINDFVKKNGLSAQDLNKLLWAFWLVLFNDTKIDNAQQNTLKLIRGDDDLNYTAFLGQLFDGDSFGETDAPILIEDYPFTSKQLHKKGLRIDSYPYVYMDEGKSTDVNSKSLFNQSDENPIINVPLDKNLDMDLLNLFVKCWKKLAKNPDLVKKADFFEKFTKKLGLPKEQSKKIQLTQQVYSSNLKAVGPWIINAMGEMNNKRLAKAYLNLAEILVQKNHIGLLKRLPIEFVSLRSINLLISLPDEILGNEILFNQWIKDAESEKDFSENLNTITRQLREGLPAIALFSELDSAWLNKKNLQLLKKIPASHINEQELVTVLNDSLYASSKNRVLQLVIKGIKPKLLLELKDWVTNDTGFNFLLKVNSDSLTDRIVKTLIGMPFDSPILPLLLRIPVKDAASWSNWPNVDDEPSLTDVLSSLLCSSLGDATKLTENMILIRKICNQSIPAIEVNTVIFDACIKALKNDALNHRGLSLLNGIGGQLSIDKWQRLLEITTSKPILALAREKLINQQDIIEWGQKNQKFNLESSFVPQFLEYLALNDLLSTNEEIAVYYNHEIKTPECINQRYNKILKNAAIDLGLENLPDEKAQSILRNHVKDVLKEIRQENAAMANRLLQRFESYANRHFNYDEVLGRYVPAKSCMGFLYKSHDDELGLINHLVDALKKGDLVRTIALMQKEKYAQIAENESGFIRNKNYASEKFARTSKQFQQLIESKEHLLTLLYQSEEGQSFDVNEVVMLNAYAIDNDWKVITNALKLRNSFSANTFTTTTGEKFVLESNEDEHDYSLPSFAPPTGTLTSGAKPTDVITRTPFELFQFEDYELLSGMAYLQRQHASIIRQHKKGLYDSQNDISYYPVVSTDLHMLLDPKRDKQNRQYFRLKKFKKDMTSLLDSYQPTSRYQPESFDKPVVFFGIINTDGNHYVPYFIFKNAKGKVFVRTIDPSPSKFHRGSGDDNKKDGKEKLEERMHRAFSWIFPGCDYADCNVTQMLRQRDCGPLSLYTLHDVLSKANTTNPIVDVTDDSLNINTQLLAINEKAVDFDESLGEYKYSSEIEQKSSIARNFWLDVFKQEKNYQLPIYKGIDEDLHFKDNWRIKSKGLPISLICEDILPESDKPTHLKRAQFQFDQDQILQNQSELYLHIAQRADELLHTIKHKITNGGEIEDKDVEDVIAKLPQELIAPMAGQALFIIKDMIYTEISTVIKNRLIDEFSKTNFNDEALFIMPHDDVIERFVTSDSSRTTLFQKIKPLEQQASKNHLRQLLTDKILKRSALLLEDEVFADEIVLKGLLSSHEGSAVAKVLHALRRVTDEKGGKYQKAFGYLNDYKQEQLIGLIERRIDDVMKKQTRHLVMELQVALIKSPKTLTALYNDKDQATDSELFEKLSLSLPKDSTLLDEKSKVRPLVIKAIIKQFTANIDAWLKQGLASHIESIYTNFKLKITTLTLNEVDKLQQEENKDWSLINQLSDGIVDDEKLLKDNVAEFFYPQINIALNKVLNEQKSALVAKDASLIVESILSNYQPNHGLIRNLPVLVDGLKSNKQMGQRYLDSNDSVDSNDSESLSALGDSVFDAIFKSKSLLEKFNQIKTLNQEHLRLENQLKDYEALIAQLKEQLLDYPTKEYVFEALNRASSVVERLKKSLINKDKSGFDHWQYTLNSVNHELSESVYHLSDVMVKSTKPGEVNPRHVTNVIRPALCQLLNVTKFNDGKSIPIVLRTERAYELDQILTQRIRTLEQAVSTGQLMKTTLAKSNLAITSPNDLSKLPDENVSSLKQALAQSINWWRAHHSAWTTLKHWRFNQARFGADHFSSQINGLMSLMEQEANIALNEDTLIEYIERQSNLTADKSDTELTHSEKLIRNLASLPIVTDHNYYNYAIGFNSALTSIEADNLKSHELRFYGEMTKIIDVNSSMDGTTLQQLDTTALKALLAKRWSHLKTVKEGDLTYLNPEPSELDKLCIAIAKVIAEKESTVKTHFKLPAAYLMPDSHYDREIPIAFKRYRMPAHIAKTYFFEEGDILNSIDDLPVHTCFIMPDGFPTTVSLIKQSAKPKDDFYEIVHPLTLKPLSITESKKVIAFGEHGKRLNYMIQDIRPTKRSIDLLVTLLHKMVVKGGGGFYYDRGFGMSQKRLDGAVRDFFKDLSKFPELEVSALLEAQIPTEGKGVTIGSLFGASAGVGQNKRGYQDGRCTHETGKQCALVAYQYGISPSKLPKDARDYVNRIKSNIPLKEPLSNDAYELTHEDTTTLVL
jgi:hypothetical protein